MVFNVLPDWPDAISGTFSKMNARGRSTMIVLTPSMKVTASVSSKPSRWPDP